MRILELYSGTASFSNEAIEQGHRTFTIDVKKGFLSDLTKDMRNVTKNDIPFIPDVIWASPPCEEYSHAKRRGVRDLELADSLVMKAIEIISWYPGVIYFIENPQTGLLKNRPFMACLTFRDVSYCKYGLPFRKQTRIWTNCYEWLPRPLCKKDCDFMIGNRHKSSAGNGRSCWTDKSFTRSEKGMVPQQLCNEILNSLRKPEKKEGGKG